MSLGKRGILLGFALSVACTDLTAPKGPSGTIVANFDPLAAVPVIPLPNDLAFTGGDGVHLNVPDGPMDSDAQKEFNTYLRTLDGFPSSTPGTATFSAALDAKTVAASTAAAPGSVFVFNVTRSSLLAATDYSVSLD